jgi:hypothetical protein
MEAPMPEPVSKEAREAAAAIVESGCPGLGNGNKVVADEIRGGLHDDYAIVQAFQAIRRDEAEKCAMVVDEHGVTWGLQYRSMTDTLAAAIRARHADGEADGQG